MRNTKLTALTLAVTMVLSVVAPGAVVAQAAAAGNTSLSVTTDAPTNVTATSATLNGNLTELSGADNASVYFLYWAAESNDTSATDRLRVEATGSFGIDVAGLEPDTTYVVEAYAEANETLETGGEVTFTTEPVDDLTVETHPATNITNTSATLNGNLTDLGGAENATVRFHYWIEGDHSTLSVTEWQAFDAPGRFSAAVDGLQSNTTYVVRAHAETTGSDAAGDEETFTTDADAAAPLGVDTNAASDVTDASATLNGELTGLGGADNATVWFEYWIEGDTANTTKTSESTLDAPGEFEASIVGLDNDTTYVYQAHARANGTTVTGEDVAFTTEAAAADDAPKNFGLRVSDFIHGLLDGGIDDDETFGRLVAQFVVANNPGSDNRPDHAGPPWLDDGDSEEHGNETDDEADDDRGPPEHAGPPDHAGPKDDDEEESDEDDDAETDDEDEQDEDEGEEEDEADEDESEAEEDDEDDDDDNDDNGPPEHAGPPDDDDDNDDDA